MWGMTNPEMEIRSERIDDLPVLIERLKQMKVGEIIDETVGTHHLWEGLSKGWSSMVWLAHIVMTGDHRKVHVRRMLNDCRESVSRLLGVEVRESEFNDDRLGRILSALGQAGRAEEIERRMNEHCIRYYRLKTDKAVMRIDTTSVSVHGSDDGSGLIAHGYSKDHRPDLMQFKVLMATLDPLGLPLVTQMVAGNASDDGLYIPAYEEAVKSIGTDGMVVGDSKMSALGTRAHIQRRGGRYITPLARVGKVPEQLDEWVRAALDRSVHLRVLKSEAGAKIGRAYEVTREQTHSAESGQTTCWIERVIVAQSDDYARSQERGLRERVQATEHAIRGLTAKTGRGHRQYRSADELQTACQRLIQQRDVAGLLDIQIKKERQLHPAHKRAGRPAKDIQPPMLEDVRFVIKKVVVNQAELRHGIARLGWRVYVTNATSKEWPLHDVILAYRAEWRIEHGFHLLKGNTLSIAPLYLTKPVHIRGLLCLLSLGLRALTLIQFSVSQMLQTTGENIKGISPAYPHQITDRPSPALILCAFKTITVTIIQQVGQRIIHVPPLNAVQQKLLLLLGLPPDLYSRLACADYSANLPLSFSER
jgi:transposase